MNTVRAVNAKVALTLMDARRANMQVSLEKSSVAALELGIGYLEHFEAVVDQGLRRFS
jgi:hypothetical protein